MRSLLTGVLVVLLACTMAGGALALSPAEKEAVETAKAWLALVDQGKYDQSWQEAAVYFKEMVKQEQWSTRVSPVRQQFGQIISRKAASAKAMSSLPGAPDGEYWILIFNTSFANKREALETVSLMKDPDTKWRVVGYFIR